MESPTETGDTGTPLRPPPPRSLPADDAQFTQFWSAYPRKVGKGSARRAWQRALRSGADPGQIIAAAERFRDECGASATPATYIPHPASWLSGERYADDALEAPQAGAPVVFDDEQLLAAVVILGQDRARPITVAQMIIDVVRQRSGYSGAGDAVVTTAERAQELAAMPYAEYLETPEWQARRKIALRSAGNRCQVCNRSRELHVHHRTYERRGAELPGDLTVLCDECHALYHGKGLIAEESA